MRHIIKIIMLITLISGCSAIGYQPEIQQGNIIYPAEVDRVKPGMSAEQVVDIMGSPVLVDTFNHNRFDYVYTLKRSHHRMIMQQVIIHFSGGRVASLEREFV